MYQMTPPQPPKKGKKGLSFLQMLLIAAALGFVAWYLYTTFVPEASPYATIEAGTLGARYKGDAVIVRDEVPYDAEGVISVDYLAEEGSVIYNRTNICEVYSSGYNSRESATLQDYRDQIKEYQQSLLESDSTADAQLDRLDAEVIAKAKEIRQMIAGTNGNMLNQERLLDTAITARQQYLQEKYNTDQRLSRMYDDERAQEQRIASWTKMYIATQESIVSFYSDGYEYGLNMNTYLGFTPAEVRRMYNGQKPELSTTQKGKTTIYRTIQDGNWGVLLLVKDSNWTPVDGQSYELMLEKFEDTHVMATVVSSTRSGGELLVRFHVSSPVEPVLYMRTCTAEVGEYITSLKVPSRAIYVQDEMNGVVVVNGNSQGFIPVNILLRDGDDVYVEAIQQGLLYEGQTVRLF